MTNIFGYYIAQIGNPTDNKDLLEASRINSHIIINPNASYPANTLPIKCDLTELPFLPESIDAIVLFHTLEFSKNPKAIIKEIYDSLIFGGYLIVLNFNPYSLWGINKLFKHEKHGIWQGKWLSPWKLRNILSDVGFDSGDYQTFYFRPPMSTPNRFLFLEGMGELFWQYCGASFMFIAKKISIPLTPIAKIETYAVPSEAIKGLPKPTSRTTQCNQN